MPLKALIALAEGMASVPSPHNVLTTPWWPITSVQRPSSGSAGSCAVHKFTQANTYTHTNNNNLYLNINC